MFQSYLDWDFRKFHSFRIGDQNTRLQDDEDKIRLYWKLDKQIKICILCKDSQLHKEELVSNLSETFRPTFPDVEFSNLFLLVILAFFLNFNLLSITSILRDRIWSKLLLLSCLVLLLYKVDCLWFQDKEILSKVAFFGNFENLQREFQNWPPRNSVY